MRWIKKQEADEQKVRALATSLSVSLPIAQLLVQRGIEDFDTAKAFFRPSFDQLHHPFSMKDMAIAVERILSALSTEESIMVYGDYDVDGTTSVALMSSFLQKLSKRVVPYIPDRYDEGYGLSYRGIDCAAEQEISLIIALDCGIKAIDKVAYAKEKGIDIIICDHHRPGAEIPEAEAILNPKQEGCNYPYKELCGCGIGFKLIQALGAELGHTEEELLPYLDLVATAIGADIVPIDGENRTLASLGLKQINTAPRPGFKALIDQLELNELTISNVIFIIAPRINAAGRMNHGLQAVELLLEENLSKAKTLVAAIEHNNSERRSVEARITQEALEQLKELKEETAAATVVYDQYWHKGVIGIVASRLIENYYRPTLVFTKSGDQLAASARSVKGFDIYEAIEACKEHLIQFGGHKYAAGVTLKPEQYDDFKKAFNSYVDQHLAEELKTPSLSIDLELNFSEITPKFYRILHQFEPFGPGNWAPIFYSTDVRDSGYAKVVGAEGTHLKAKLRQDEANEIDAIGFNLGRKLEFLTGRKSIDVVYAIDHNSWRGKTALQLKLKDLKPCDV